MTLTVTPSAATSLARVLLQPTRARRRPFDTARRGMGVSTPDDVSVMMRPQPRSTIGGKSRCVSVMMLPTIASKPDCQASGGAERASPGAGPPELLIRISTPPRASMASARAATLSGAARSSPCGVMLPPRAGSTCAARAWMASTLRAAPITLTPSLASDTAMAAPSPLLAPSTNALFPTSPSFMPRSPPGASAGGPAGVQHRQYHWRSGWGAACAALQT